MKIVLIGLRGSGKTKIGKLLSKKLSLPLFDSDEEIEKVENLTTAKIVKIHGWEYFREKEKEVIKKTLKLDNVIISAGGGTIIYPENQKALRKNSIIIYLKRSPENCYKWIRDDEKRPSITGEKDLLKDLKKVYKERKPIYEKTANVIIERTEDLEKDTGRIIRFLSST